MTETADTTPWAHPTATQEPAAATHQPDISDIFPAFAIPAHPQASDPLHMHGITSTNLFGLTDTPDANTWDLGNPTAHSTDPAPPGAASFPYTHENALLPLDLYWPHEAFPTQDGPPQGTTPQNDLGYDAFLQMLGIDSETFD
ncbi:hypothetical protein [Streptomyces sp. NPDC007856]|uniref:hypothetical protein n=1 Tax=Streptomyces sp. NPDC007856 TaxID=3364781 RepID=UPI0036B225E6